MGLFDALIALGAPAAPSLTVPEPDRVAA
jgi:hypothetical protein